MNNDFNKKLPDNITTERLILRTPMLDDVDAITELASNIKIHNLVASLPYPYKETHAIDFINNLARTKDEHAFAIISKQGNYVGTMGFHILSNKIELGYWLGEPYWGKGYATEAARALLSAALETNICPPIISRAISKNIGSINVLKKCGFIIEDERIDDCSQHKGVMVTYLKYEPQN